MEKGYRKISDLVGVICLLIGAGVLIRTACFVVSADIWFDELFTVELAVKNTGSLLAYAARDVHPPLYYLIVRLVYIILNPIFGTGIVSAAKITSFIPYALVLIYLVTYIRRRTGLLSSGLAFLMILTMPHMSEYIVEARMYSWAAFAVLAMFIHAVEMIRVFGADYEDGSDRKLRGQKILHMACMFIYGVCAMYLHYYSFICAMIIAVCTVVCVIVRLRKAGTSVYIKQISALIICVIVAVIAYIPWIKVLLTQMGQVSAGYWIQPVSIRTIPGCLKYIFSAGFESGIVNYACAGILILAYACMMGIYILRCLKSGKNSGLCADGDSDAGLMSSPDPAAEQLYIFGCPVLLAALILAGLILSVIFRPVFVYRYMMPAMFVFWMGYAILIKKTIDVVVGSKAAHNVTSGTTKSDIPDRSRIPYIAFISAVSALAIAALIMSGIRSFNLFRWEESHKASGMERTKEVFDEIRRDYPDTLIVCNFNQIQALMWYYLDNDSVLWGWTDETLIADICGSAPIVMTTDADELKQIVEERGQNSFLFFGSGNARDEIIAEWNSYEFFTELLQDSCFLERYYINIYEIAF